jgi:hypothetical protein
LIKATSHAQCSLNFCQWFSLACPFAVCIKRPISRGLVLSHLRPCLPSQPLQTKGSHRVPVLTVLSVSLFVHTYENGYFADGSAVNQRQQALQVVYDLVASTPLHSQGSPNNGGQNQKSKPPLGVTMMPLGAPSISKYGSLVRLDAQIVALRAHCAQRVHPTLLFEPPMAGAFCSFQFLCALPGSM